ncbi:intervening sequence, 23S rRNA [Carboxydothermus hydrogenoformans Z-2901]|uniref:Intervening sequence, 23S rRNA n=1 Tax=Carboxydothermus hydrogenoformans (strain ATCC BAA-161 / DSM 6008 / Z-2901) TaxID=246194 RepID=Q3AEW3_CARHZ|nr:intervening sequence, 23S rRNA [Carboxydothermus hydrogenoformans Z-2901]
MIYSFKDLEVYQTSYNLALEIYKIITTFPKYEQYELASQFRRAVISIPLNIAEGFGRKRSILTFKSFILNSLGSCNEVLVLLDFAKDLNYLDENTYQYFYKEYELLAKKINRLYANWK